MGLNFSKNELIHIRFTTELKNFVAYCVFLTKLGFIVLHDFNLTYYSSIILGSFSILLFSKLCWHIGLAPILRIACLIVRKKFLQFFLKTWRFELISVKLVCIKLFVNICTCIVAKVLVNNRPVKHIHVHHVDTV